MWDKVTGFFSGESRVSVAELASNIRNFFVSLNTKIDNAFVNEFSTITSNKMDAFLKGIFTIIGIYLTCWILYQGYLILFGRNNRNVKDFMWDAFLKFIFITLCFFPGEWMVLIKDAIGGIREYIRGGFAGVPILHSLGTFGAYSMISSMSIMQNISVIPFTDSPNPLTAFLTSVFIWSGFLLGAFPLIRTYTVNAIMFFVALAITPLAFYFLIFHQTKQIFVQWLNVLISNLLVLLFINIFIGAIFSYCLPKLSDVTGQSQTISAYLVAFTFIMYGYLLNIFVSISNDLAKSLTQISMDSAVGSAVGSATARVGTVAGLGVGATVMAGRGHLILGKAGMNFAKKAFDKFRKSGGK